MKVPARGEATVTAAEGAPSRRHRRHASGVRRRGRPGHVHPAERRNKGVALHVPYYLVPQATSNVDTQLDTQALVRNGSAIATTTNRRGAVAGIADWYAWGLSDRKRAGQYRANDITAVGAQSFPRRTALAASGSRRTSAWSNASRDEFDIFVDVNRDGTDDYDVVGVDYGALTTRGLQRPVRLVRLRPGVPATVHRVPGRRAVQQQHAAAAGVRRAAVQRRIAVLVGIEPADHVPRPRHRPVNDSDDDVVDGTATFNAFSPASRSACSTPWRPTRSATETVAIDRTEWADRRRSA